MSRCRNSLSSLSSRKKGYRFLRGPIDRSDRYRSWGGLSLHSVWRISRHERTLLYKSCMPEFWYSGDAFFHIHMLFVKFPYFCNLTILLLHFYPTFPWINLCSSSTWMFSSPGYKLDIHNKTSFTKSQTNWKLPCFNYQSLIGGFNHLEKYESQWEGLSHILWKIKHVWNHSIMFQLSIFIFHGYVPISVQKFWVNLPGLLAMTPHWAANQNAWEGPRANPRDPFFVIHRGNMRI